MDQEKRRGASGEHLEEGPRDFENISREVREGQSPALDEAGTEEDRKQWEKTRDLREEARQVTDNEPHRRGEDLDHSEG